LNAEGLRQRGAVLAALRGWFADHGYVEVPTPALVPSPALEESLFAVPAGDGWLRTSPEFALKRVLAAGLPRIYELGPCFRDRERGDWHGREFLMLEWYRVGASLPDLMDEVEALVAAAARAVNRPAPPLWERISVRDLFMRTVGVDLAHQRADAAAPRADEDWDTAFFRAWVDQVEPSLQAPTFVFDWPASQAALARVFHDPVWPTTQRFEAYLGGVELANAFLELIDSAEQRRRFHAANAKRAAAGEAPHPLDERLIEAVGRMPPTSGIAMGVDRLVAAVCGWDSIAPGRVD